MARPIRSNPRLQDRDYDVLEHLMRYRLTTPEVLHRLFFEGSDRNAVTKVTSRLCADEFLLSHSLYGSNTYFTLGRRGAKASGLGSGKVGPLGPQACYREFGALSFCCLGNQQRERLRVSEIASKSPQLLSKRIDSAHYYIDHDGTVARLGYIWVEAGGSVDHIVRTVRQDIIDKRRALPYLLEQINGQRFVVAVVTCTQEKKEAITLALRQLASPVLFRIEFYPELIHLLPGTRHV